LPESAKALIADRSGATAIEYSLLAALITVALIVAMTTIGDKVSAMFNSLQF
jgi:pilus assembly protein Flp/PilA